MRVKTIAPLILSVTLAWASMAHADILGGYDPCQGTPPQQQGFVLEEGNGAPAPQVENCILHQGPLGGDMFQNWSAMALPIDFDLGLSLWITLEVIYSEITVNPDEDWLRVGYSYTAVDGSGRYLALAISDEAVGIVTDPFAVVTFPINYSPAGVYEYEGGILRQLDATTLHEYRLDVFDGLITLFVDDDPFLEFLVGESVLTDPPRIWFGDGTVWANSETDLHFLAYNIPDSPRFHRGDCNGDGAFEIADVIFLVEMLISIGNPTTCEDGCDANDDGALDFADVFHGLAFLFGLGAPPAAPGSHCGWDPTEDFLDCADYQSCP